MRALFVGPGEVAREDRVRRLTELPAIQFRWLPPMLGVILDNLLEGVEQIRELMSMDPAPSTPEDVTVASVN